ncbi:MAG: sigma 54-interacting transcriptional regulator [Deltaproteobacteria bacterium]|jgi:two-component system NtrC family response regulator|nr:sigma 54-interacting transcriptional regulator [Deltaproteobacteria bacterium]
MIEKILIVDDEPNYQLVIGEMLKAEGYTVLTAGSGEEAFRIFAGDPEVDLVLTDMTMPNGSGIDLLEKTRKMRPEVPVIMLTAHGTVELAVKAMKQGAFDYLTKPYKNDELTRTVAKALEVSRLGRHNKELQEALEERHSFGNLIGKSKAMRDLYQILEKVAASRANALITGESGTGKELVARAIHYNSPRRDKAFVAVNCSALAATLLESELFGREKGAYTGADRAKAGRFELAHEGTLFLDEVGEMDQNVQVKLLRALQERTIERVGGGEPVAVNVRIVSATNRVLKDDVEQGRFREDLFYRLNVVHIPIPPLRDRMEDMQLLAAHFLAKHTQDGAAPKRLNHETVRLMYAHRWPGNVRELENVIERGLVLAAGGEIMPEDLPPELLKPQDGPVSPPAAPGGRRSAPPAPPDGGPETGAGRDHWVWKALEEHPPGGPNLAQTLLALEEGLLRRAMDAENGVQARAADALGVKRNVFKYKWDKFAGGTPPALAGELADYVPLGEPLADSLDAFEEALLLTALEKCGGSQAKAADLLGLRRNLFLYKVRKYPGLTRWLETSSKGPEGAA